MDTEHTDIDGITPAYRRGPPVIRRLLAVRGRLLATLGAAAVALAVALPLFYLLGDTPDEPLPLAVADHEMPDETTDVCDLAGYSATLSGSDDPYFGTLQRVRLLELLDDPVWQNYVGLKIDLAFDYLRFGEAEEAISLLSEALESQERDDPDGEDVQKVLEELATSSIPAPGWSARCPWATARGTRTPKAPPTPLDTSSGYWRSNPRTSSTVGC